MARLLTVLLALAAASAARADIIGLLEAPELDASQVSNVQGWVYTDTPGATLIQPFDVLVGGVKTMEVPCCSPRGDVQDQFPDAPLNTGFSGVTNWAREADNSPTSVQVVVRDTAGGELILTSVPVFAYSAATFPFSSNAQWSNAAPAAASVDNPQGFVQPRTSWCALSNDGPDDSAQLVCTGLISTRGDGAQAQMCGGTHRFIWEKASQGFKLRSNCEDVDRWVEHGDGTVTDRWTGLRWEVMTPLSVDLTNQWSSTGVIPDGTAFTAKVAQANGSGAIGCFAGFCDWRVPTLDELFTLVDVFACDEPDEPCTTIPGETATNRYWTSNTPVQEDLTIANFVNFATGAIGFGSKTGLQRLRMVRGALPTVTDTP